jgi:hypothetical protein
MMEAGPTARRSAPPERLPAVHPMIPDDGVTIRQNAMWRAGHGRRDFLADPVLVLMHPYPRGRLQSAARQDDAVRYSKGRAAKRSGP